MAVFNLLIKLFTDWRFITAVSVFLVVLVVIFVKYQASRYLKRNKNRKSPLKKAVPAKQHKQPLKQEESGKLYVPASNYDVLKKEGLIHPPEENPKGIRE